MTEEALNARFDQIHDMFSELANHKSEKKFLMERHVTTILVSLITAGIIYVGFSVTNMGGEIKLLKFQVASLETHIREDWGEYATKENMVRMSERIDRIEAKLEKLSQRR